MPVKRYKLIRLNTETYNNLMQSKDNVQKELQMWSGKEIRLTTPKFINALIIKNKEIEGILPFNKKELYKFIKNKESKYE